MKKKRPYAISHRSLRDATLTRRAPRKASNELEVHIRFFAEDEIVSDTENDVETDCIEGIFFEFVVMNIASFHEGIVDGNHAAEVEEGLKPDENVEVNFSDFVHEGGHEAHFERLQVPFEASVIEAIGGGDGFVHVSVINFDGSERVVHPEAEVDEIEHLIAEGDPDGGVLDGHFVVADLECSGELCIVEERRCHGPVEIQPDADAHVESEHGGEFETAGDVEDGIAECDFIDEVSSAPEFSEDFELNLFGLGLRGHDRRA